MKNYMYMLFLALTYSQIALGMQEESSPLINAIVKKEKM
jgi:hypothetical protein